MSNRNKFQKLKEEDVDQPESEKPSEKFFNMDNISIIPLLFVISALIVSLIFLIILFGRIHNNILCSHDLIYGVNIEKEGKDTFSVVNMAAAKMEIDRAINGTKLGKCMDHCQKAFNVGPYRCTNQFCQMCQVSASLEKHETYYSLCIHACDCCATGSCADKCSIFVKDHACNFDCSKFGYSRTPCS